MQQAASMPQPFLSYLHFLPPHGPYRTRKEFISSFYDDGYLPPEKPRHPVVPPHEIIHQQAELEFRQNYDEFLPYVDTEFYRLFSYLDEQGVLDNTLLVFTSDHGEMFERNMKGHNDPYLYDPVAKVPLIIFEPGQTERRDIHDLTSCIDLLPSLLHYTGHEIPPNLPGQILPRFAEPVTERSRTIYAMDARQNRKQTHITKATLMMRRDSMKVVRYSGYGSISHYYEQTDNPEAMQNDSKTHFEVFDLDTDPEELYNLAEQPTPEIQALIDELEQFFRENIEYPQ
jgi:arylsulfatase A-like enzyme